MNFQEATAMIKSSFDAKQEVYGEFSTELAEAHKLLASIELSKGNINKAVREYKKVGTSPISFYVFVDNRYQFMIIKHF